MLISLVSQLFSVQFKQLKKRKGEGERKEEEGMRKNKGKNEFNVSYEEQIPSLPFSL